MNILEIQNLKKNYTSSENKMQTVVDVSHFQIPEREQVVIHGPSGTGKTTFLNLIAGILKADEGNISVAGHEMNVASESERDHIRGRYIGYVFQTFNLLQGYTVFENVLLAMMFGNGADEKFARHLIERVGLKERAAFYPRQLSVGQQQRVAVARALSNRPKIVLADEPTSNLDPKNSKEVLRLIREMCAENNASLLLVSHDEIILKQFESVFELSKINRACSNGEMVAAPSKGERL